MISKTTTAFLKLCSFSIFVLVLSSPDTYSQKMVSNEIKHQLPFVSYLLYDVSVDRFNSRINGDANFTAITDTTRKKDRDGDGIVDSLDKCPDEKGVIEYDGCPIPDSDNDGIADDVDLCPTIAGLAKYKGCPTPDKDGDKINDEDDKCPNEPGVARYNGCPVGDRDGDGVNDDDDKCIDTPGTVANHGCAENKKLKAKKLKVTRK